MENPKDKPAYSMGGPKGWKTGRKAMKQILTEKSAAQRLAEFSVLDNPPQPVSQTLAQEGAPPPSDAPLQPHPKMPFDPTKDSWIHINYIGEDNNPPPCDAPKPEPKHPRMPLDLTKGTVIHTSWITLDGKAPKED